MLTAQQRQLRGRLAAASAKLNENPDNPARAEHVADLRRQFKESQLAEHIKKAIAQAPPLTAEQRSRLARLLTAAGR